MRSQASSQSNDKLKNRESMYCFARYVCSLHTAKARAYRQPQDDNTQCNLSRFSLFFRARVTFYSLISVDVRVLLAARDHVFFSTNHGARRFARPTTPRHADFVCKPDATLAHQSVPFTRTDSALSRADLSTHTLDHLRVNIAEQTLLHELQFLPSLSPSSA